MDKNLDLIARELFGKVRTQFPKIQLGDADSKVTDRPSDARFFEFDYVKHGKNLGTISISLSEDDGVVVMYSNDIVDGQSEGTKKQWFNFLEEMRDFAKSRLMNFSVRDIAKTNLEKRDYKFLANKHGDINMAESKLYGTSKTSFQTMGEAKLIVRHSKPVNYDLPAGRTMHIESIYVESAEGERFKYPFKHLNGARALAQHVAHGGTSYDDIGQHIISLSEELNKLRMFKGYVDRNPIVAEAMDSVNNKVYERLDLIKKEIHSLQNPRYYSAFAESFTKHDEQMIPEDVVNDWVDRLTIRTFNEELKNVFPYIFKLMGENINPVKELTPDDILAAQSVTNESEYEREITELSDFESYIEDLVKEDNDLFNSDETQSIAIQKLNQLMGSEVPAGTDGTNAIQSLKGIIDDKDLGDALKSMGKIDPEGDVRGLIKQYLEAKDKENGTDIATKINFEGGETAEAPPEAAPAMPPEAAAAPAPDAGAVPPEAAPAPVAEGDDDDFAPWYASKDEQDKDKHKSSKHVTPGKHGQGYSQARHLARTGMANAVNKAKKAGATAETIINFGSGEMSLGEAIKQAGLNVNDFFTESKDNEIVEFVKSMYDETTGKFPKGETGVMLSVEKEFGEDAAELAKHLISELSTIYESKRLRQLAGITETGLQKQGMDVAEMFKALGAKLR